MRLPEFFETISDVCAYWKMSPPTHHTAQRIEGMIAGYLGIDLTPKYLTTKDEILQFAASLKAGRA